MKKFLPRLLSFLLIAAIAERSSLAADAPAQPAPGAAKPAAPSIPAPTLPNVAYGPHAKQVLDFWKAESAHPTPLLFFIHGGGWEQGDKSMEGNTGYFVPRFLKAGISVVSINYRMLSDAVKENIVPPVKAPLGDAARALQFVRSKAKEWNLNGNCIGAGGSSAGACSALWLAFHDDMSNPQSDDPVARESTRLAFAAVFRAQTSLDPKEMKEWIPNMNYAGTAFGFSGSTGEVAFNQFYAAREKILPWIKEYSPYGWSSSNDPPIYLFYNDPPAMNQNQKAPAHSANFGVKLQEKLRSVGVECRLTYPELADDKYPTPADFLIAMLTNCQRKHPFGN